MKNTTLLMLISFLSIVSAQAQLKVDNGSYVYVKDTYIFVEQGINIASGGHVYLREESQVLQGDHTNPANSGLGQLSVYQEADATQFSYNFWGSPVGLPDAGVNNSHFKFGSADGLLYDVVDNLESTIAAYTPYNSYEGSSSPLTISSRWLYKYLPGTAYADWVYVGINGSVEPGLGFTMKGTDVTDQRYDFRGKPRDGDITVPITNGNSTLVGNPYPSALDLAAFVLDNPTTGGEILFYEHDMDVESHYLTNYQAGYGVWVPGSIDPNSIDDAGDTGTYVPATYHSYDSAGNDIGANTGAGAYGGNTNVFSGRRYIPIGQGFMIQGVSDNDAVFKNTQRVYFKESQDPDLSQFHRPAATTETFNINDNEGDNLPTRIVFNNGIGEAEINTINYPSRYIFQVIVNDTYTRELSLNISPETTLDFDYGFDGKASGLLNTDAAFTIANAEYVIQSTNFDIDAQVPIHFKTNGQTASFRLKLGGIINLDESQEVYLFDSTLNEYHQLNNSDYTFTINTNDTTDRYYITFKNANNDDTLDNEVIVEAQDFAVFQNNAAGQLEIKNPQLIDVRTVVMHDMSGKRIFNKLNLDTQNSYSFPTSKLSNGVYVVSITTNDNQTVVQKIIVGN